MGTVTGRRQGTESTTSPILAQEEVQKEVLRGYPRPIHTRRKVPQEHD